MTNLSVYYSVYQTVSNTLYNLLYDTVGRDMYLQVHRAVSRPTNQGLDLADVGNFIERGTD